MATLAIRSPVFGQSFLHVDASGSDSNNGSTWSLAKAALHGALTTGAATSASVEIRVNKYGFTDLYAFGLWLGIDGPVVAMELLGPFTTWGDES